MSDDPQPQAPSGSKLLVEFGPLVVFFAMNAWRGIYWATGAFMVALAAAIVVTKLRGEKVPPMTLFAGAMVMVFGGLTLWFEDDRFIKIKVTIVNALFGVILLFGLVTGRNFLSAVLGQTFQLDELGWKKFTLRYAVFFLVLAVVNEVIWRNASGDVWVAFKFPGLLILTLLFTLSQVPLLQRHQIEPESAGEPAPEDPAA